MLPPLFGLSWGMYAVVGAIVLLLILLLVMTSQRRKKAALSAHLEGKPAPKAKSAGKAKPVRHQTKAERAAQYAELRRAAAAEAAAAEGAQYAPALGSAYAAGLPVNPLPQAPLPPAGYMPPSIPANIPPAPAPHVHAVPMEDILPGSDPLQNVIQDLLSGWGDLTQEDTNRLSVFRPDRVLAAVASAEMPKDKANEYARARLAQLRRWASGLEQTIRRDLPGPSASPEYAGIASVVAAAALAATPAVMPPIPTVAAAPAGPPPVAPVPSFAAPMLSVQPVLPAQPPTPAPASSFFGTEPPVAPAVAFTPAPTAQAAPMPAELDDVSRSAEAAIAAAAAAFWARPEMGTTAPIPQGTPAVDAAPAQSWPQAAAFPPLGQELPVLTVHAPVVEIPGIVAAAPTPQAAPGMGLGSDTFLQDLGSRVTTAESLLALPPAERPGMLAFLKPSELGRVLQASQDSELKKAVIETLESVGSPSAIDLIYRSLDDPDPEIQAKALEAADRLLGA